MANQYTTNYNFNQNQDIIQAYKNGELLDDIARRYSMPKNSIWRIANRAGLNRISKKRTQLTDKIRQAVISEYQQGVSTKEISKRHDLCQATVGNILKHSGYKGIRKCLSNQVREQILSLYQSGKNTYEIGRNVGFSSRTVLNVIDSAKIPKHSIFKLSQEDELQITIDYQKGESSESIAKRLVVRPNLVLAILKRRGIKRREVWPKKEVPEGQLFNPNYDPQDLPDCKFPGIYKFTNKINGKVYIGQAQNIHQRYYRHRASIIRFAFSKALKKYGIGNFVFEVLERVDDLTQIDAREQYWMDYYQCCDPKKGYNLAPVAGSCRGIKRAPEQIEAIKANLKRYYSENHPHTLGKKLSVETRKKISEARKGKPLSAEHRAKVGRSMTPERQALLTKACIEKSRKVVAQIDIKSGEVLRVWSYVGEAAKELGLPVASIQNACRGRYFDSFINGYRPKTTHGGYKWEYV